MNTIRVEPAKGAADTAVNIILNGDIISGIKAEKYNSGLNINLQGPGCDRVFALSIADCEACRLDHRRYPLGHKVTDEEMAIVNLVPDRFHGEWNYTIRPGSDH